MKVTVDNVTSGVVPDLPDFALPDGVFSDSRNVRFRDGAVEKIRGHVAVFGSLSATAIWSEFVGDGLVNYWVYASQTRLYATDGSAHADVASTTYSANLDLGWTGGAFHGYMVANDGTNPPAYWDPALTNKFQPIPAWPGATTCQVMRSFGDFLVALRTTEGGTYNPRLLRWSDAAGQGAIPASWDETDPTNQAGLTELGQTEDELVDCLPLRDSNFVYKRFATWSMQYVGPPDVFQFRQVFSQAGLLTENCVKAFKSGHFVVTDSDIIVHDGNSAQSIGDRRVRKWVFSRLSQDNYRRSFVCCDYRNREMWFCYPESGRTHPNMGLCWNWADDSFYIRELGTEIAYGSTGIISGGGVTFDADPGDFSTGGAGAFDEEVYSPWAQRLLLVDGTTPLAYQAETGETFNGTVMSVYADRSNIGLSRDVSRIKRVHRIFPKILGVTGDVVQFFIGTRATMDSPVTMTGPYNFTIGTDYKIDCRLAARFFFLRVAYTGSNSFRLLGFDMEFMPDGIR